MHHLRITHETVYRYQEAVKFGPHRMVIRPREGHDVRVEELKLEISPEFELHWSRDLFGNSIATVHLLSAAPELRIRSRVTICQTPPFPLRPSSVPAPVPMPLSFPPLELTVATAYLDPSFPDDRDAVRKWVAGVLPHPNETDALHAAEQIVKALKSEFKYRRREEKGVQTPTETITSTSGSCRDLATLMLEALRAVGFPARFASGYLDCTESDAGRASTHAWAEAYLPSMGWLGYDPTLGRATGEHHVVTGVSAHPRGVMPITGIFYGKRELYLGMDVSVRTERLAEAPATSSLVRP